MNNHNSDKIRTLDKPDFSSHIGLLNKAFINRPETDLVSTAIERAVDATLQGPEGRGVLVTAPSGAGKTTLIERIIAKNPRLDESPGSPCRIMMVSVESPCTLKDLGRNVARKAGYEVFNAGLDAATIWRRARREMKEANIRFIFFDEIQNITEPAKSGDDQLIRNTLKTLLINTEWPVGLILAGQPSVISFLESDKQVRRRMDFAKLGPLDAKSIPQLQVAVTKLTQQVELSCDKEEAAHLVPRLMHAAGYQFGFAIEILRKAIEIAAKSNGARGLTREHLAREYANRTGNAAFANPFLAADWAAIDPERCNITSPEQLIKEAPPSPGRLRRRKVAS